mmetsp:Transcript_26701/g.47312  ORF Transcript_26701/g.47312 Transcript_26701/m.47312 type:complete len:616 (+) Transcript_26701:1-1848(+)
MSYDDDPSIYTTPVERSLASLEINVDFKVDSDTSGAGTRERSRSSKQDLNLHMRARTDTRAVSGFDMRSRSDMRAISGWAIDPNHQSRSKASLSSPKSPTNLYFGWESKSSVDSQVAENKRGSRQKKPAHTQPQAAPKIYKIKSVFGTGDGDKKSKAKAAPSFMNKSSAIPNEKIKKKKRQLLGSWAALALIRDITAKWILWNAANVSRKIFKLRGGFDVKQSVALTGDAVLFGTAYEFLEVIELEKILYIADKDSEDDRFHTFGKQVVLYTDWFLRQKNVVGYKLNIGGDSLVGDEFIHNFTVVGRGIPFDKWVKGGEDERRIGESDITEARRKLKSVLLNITRACLHHQKIELHGLLSLSEKERNRIYFPIRITFTLHNQDFSSPSRHSLKDRYETLFIDEEDITLFHRSLRTQTDTRTAYLDSLEVSAIEKLHDERFFQVYATLSKYFMLRADFLSDAVPDLWRMFRSLAGDLHALCAQIKMLLKLISLHSKHASIRRALDSISIMKFYKGVRTRIVKLIVENEKCVILTGTKPHLRNLLDRCDAVFSKSGSFVSVLPHLEDIHGMIACLTTSTAAALHSHCAAVVELLKGFVRNHAETRTQRHRHLPHSAR